MHLFYTPEISSHIYTLEEQESKHCIRVLRLKKGDVVHLTDGKGNLFESRIIQDNPKKCIVEVTDVRKEVGKRDFSLHIAIAPTKNIARTEWFVEKATEIGIEEITPVICHHSERKIVKTERLNKVITAAVKQSLKAYHPMLNETVKFKEFVKRGFKGQKFIAYISDKYNETLSGLYKPGSDAVILIGPEGDFSEKEVEMAIDNGFKPITLGKSRLRTETAALVACHSIELLNAQRITHNFLTHNA